jgi:hypothetical protein
LPVTEKGKRKKEKGKRKKEKKIPHPGTTSQR